MNAFFDPAGGVQTVDITTPEGRAKLFKKRIDDLTKPKTQGGPGLTMDQAIFELRTSEDAKDVELLAAMGDGPSKVRTEKLRNQQHIDELNRLAEENANAAKPAPEVAEAARRAAATNERRLMAINSRLDEKLIIGGLSRLAEENANAAKSAPEVAEAARRAAATNERRLAFNSRLDELLGRGLSIDQAVDHMRANSQDAALLASMGG